MISVISQMWYLIPIILGFRSLRRGDCCKFEVIVGDIMGSKGA